MSKKKYILIAVMALLLASCATRREILYLQDADFYNTESIKYETSKIQPNDILNILVTAIVPETTLPYNNQVAANTTTMSLDLLKLQGYLVSTEGEITFPVLGKIMVRGMSTSEIEKDIENRLSSGGHLKDATVSVRLLNAKVTVLGEVKNPGTYDFTEQNITLPQALGYAGDLTIYGERRDVLLITEENGLRRVIHIDLTNGDFMDNGHYYLRPNDFIVVNPNTRKVKSAGVIGDAGTVLTIFSIVLSTVILLTTIIK